MCSLEFPDLEAAFWQRYRSQGLVVLGVTNDPTDAPVRRFIEQTGIQFDVVREPDGLGYATFFPGATGEVRSPYPLDVLIDPEGRLVSARREYRPDELRREVELLLP